MRVPSQLEQHFKILQEKGFDIEPLFNDFSISAKEKFLRSFVAPFLTYLPTSIRYVITDFAKKRRNPSRKPRLIYPLDCEENKAIAGSVKKKKVWGGKQFVICLSHDVDNDIGYRWTEKMLSLDIKAGIPSTFNFLTHDNYRVSKDLISAVESSGCEAGLHGYTHDQGLSFRSRSTIIRKTSRALQSLGSLKITGTRTPALSRSREILSCFAETGLKYDSTFQTGSAIYHSVRVPYPYYYKDAGIWEIPLTIQDDNYLRDASVTTEDMLDSIRRFIRETAIVNGIVVLNIHPHLMAPREGLYEQILAMLNEFRRNALFITTGRLCEIIEESAVEI
jgi:hypothetical protein